MQKVRICLGHERTAVLEQTDYKDSIFGEQYGQALREVCNYIANPLTDVSQIIAFCGDRGEGKTSCMQSFGYLLDKHKDNQDFIQATVGNRNATLLSDKRFLRLPIIDPSYFEQEYNILEYLTGQLYNHVNRKLGPHSSAQGNRKINEVLISFQKVKKGICHLHKRPEEMYDPLDEIGNFALGLNLKEEIRNLVKGILNLDGHTHLVLMIDDIDLNMEGAYEMVEQIRKYLALPECIILVSVNTEQLQTAISVAIQKNSLIETSYTLPTAEVMARKYIDKVIPVASRIPMPTVLNLCEYPLELTDTSGTVIYRNEMVKNGVVELIFVKTRYLYFNSKGGVSKIVPNNLRSLAHLIGMVGGMPSIDYQAEGFKDVQHANQHEFRHYFFKDWTKGFDEATIRNINIWTDAPLDNALNRQVIEFLSENIEFSNFLGRDFSKESTEGEEAKKPKPRRHDFNYNPENPETQIDSILSSDNFSYNISVGDVFYLINCLEKDYISEEADRILFFIKSLYSIKLYENYDVISEQEGMIYPADNDARGIYRSDDRFLHTNVLQRMVNGSYFTYSPGEFIAYDKVNNDSPVDQRTILGIRYERGTNNIYGLNKLIRDVVKDWGRLKDMDEKETEEYYYRLMMAEFFVLTISRSINSKKREDLRSGRFIEKDMIQRRANVLPFAYPEFTVLNGYYIFDVLAPFANLINVEYAFNRFAKGSELFKIACECKESLIYNLIRASYTGRGYPEEEIDQKITKAISDAREDGDDFRKAFYKVSHVLLSDSVIRNAEILAALNEDGRLNRDALSKMGSKESLGYPKLLSNFYEKLIYSEERAMTTHRRNNDGDGDPHHIRFGFLRAFIDFLNSIAEKGSRLHILFNEIFNPSFGLSDFDKRKRIEIITNFLPDKNTEYGKKEFVKYISANIPDLTPLLKEFSSSPRMRTRKTPDEWHQVIYKNYEDLQSVIDSQPFEEYLSQVWMQTLENALFKTLLPENKEEKKEEKKEENK